MMKVLAAVSLVQLMLQVAGARKAIRDGIAYELPFRQGKPEEVARDMWTMGSGLSAPWPLLGAQAAGTVLLVARPRPWLARMLGLLGAAYVSGILGERATRESLRHPDMETTPRMASALALPLAMALLGLVGRKRRTAIPTAAPEPRPGWQRRPSAATRAPGVVT